MGKAVAAIGYRISHRIEKNPRGELYCAAVCCLCGEIVKERVVVGPDEPEKIACIDCHEALINKRYGIK